MNKIKDKIVYDKDLSHDLTVGTILCYGHFNVIHPGHIRYLQHASSLGRNLCVVVQSDKELLADESEYFFSQYERALNLASIQIVDRVIIMDHLSLTELIKLIKPEHLVVGSEFGNINELDKEGSILVDKASSALSDVGGTMIFHGGEVQYSQSLLNRNFTLTEDKKTAYLNSCKKQKISRDDLLSTMVEFSRASLLVVGDTILDQYVACEPIGMSAEAPVVVMRELDDNTFLGGAGIVAAHIKALGAKCHYLSVVGSDSNADIARASLQEFGVDFNLLEDPSRPTTFKIRYLVEKQKMFRVSRLKDHDLKREIENKLIAEIKRTISKVNGILVCDFLYGVITPRILRFIEETASDHGIPVYCDLQCSSQVGSILKFSGAHLICPTEREARVSLGAKDDGLEWVANKVLEETSSKNLIMKLASDGFIAYERKEKNFINRQSFPALSENAIDVTGAGDSLLAALAVGLSSGASLMQASAIATCMAALSVETLGNKPIELKALKAKIEGFY